MKEKKTRPIKLIQNRWMKLPVPDNQIVKKFYQNGKIDSIDIQLLWRYMYYQIFLKINFQRVFEISGVLTMRATKVEYSDLSKKDPLLRRNYFYSISIILEPEILEQYTNYVLYGGDYVVFPKDAKISEWAIKRIRLRSWFSKYFINKFIIKFMEEEILRIKRGKYYKFHNIQIFATSRRNKYPHVIDKKRFRRVASLRFKRNREMMEAYTQEIIKYYDDKIIR